MLVCLPSGVVSAAALWLVTLGHVSRQTARSRPLVCGIFFIGLSVLYFRTEFSRARPAHSLLAHTGSDSFLLAPSPPQLTGSLSSKVAMPARYVSASDGEGGQIATRN